MSIVYDDIQAVTRLLQEKEKVFCAAKFYHLKFNHNFVVGFGADGAHWKGAFNKKRNSREESQ